jgi:TldD protein
MIERELCAKVLEAAVSTGADYAELFAENSKNHTVNMVSGKVDAINDAVVSGAAVRVYKGLSSVMATTVDRSEEGLIRCAKKAAAALGNGKAALSVVLRDRMYANIHPVLVVPSSVPNAEKVDILRRACEAAAGYDRRIRQVTGTFLDVDQNILIASTDGVYASDRRVRTRLSVTALAEAKDGGTQTGSCSPGRRMGMELFEKEVDPEATGREAARQAVVMAEAGYCPAGVMPVAIGNGFGGVIFHEACGHSLEASSVAFGLSQFTGKLGEKIAGEKVTAYDDGTIPNAWGSLNFDDEGTPTRRSMLIEKGVLKSYMIDKFNARRMGLPPTGSSRRESFDYTPTSRMTNTFIGEGPDENEDIIASIDEGLYAAAMGGGSVNPTTGEFNFAVREGYLVRKGKICEPVRGASLVGKGSEVIMNIDMVGKDLLLAEGMCGASSGSIPTCVGQPMIRVSSITVGGR